MKKVIGIALGYLIFAIVGLPLAFAGQVLGNESLKGAWTRSAMSFACAFSGEAPAEMSAIEFTSSTEQIQLQVADYEPADACRQAQFSDHQLVVYLYRDRIERVLKTPTKPMAWQRALPGTAFARVQLKPLKEEQMRKQGLDFTLDGAIVKTKEEFLAGRIERACARGAAVQDEVREKSKSLFSTPAKAVEVESEASTSIPVKGTRPSKSATGLVIFAGKNTVSPQGKPDYETFSVVIKQADEHEATFSGVDLKEKFEAGAFEVGQTIEIAQRLMEFSTDLGGEVKRQRKNVFEIFVKSKA